MRLIDADTARIYLSDEVCERLQTMSAVDPVHAAGGCYCRECLRGKKAGAEKVACPLSTVWRRPADFCSDGKRQPIDFGGEEVQMDG